MSDWIDELDLDPRSSWRRMGTRTLGAQPWLVVDDRRDVELAVKADLLDRRRQDVLVSGPANEAAAADVRSLIEDEGIEPPDLPDDLESSTPARRCSSRARRHTSP